MARSPTKRKKVRPVRAFTVDDLRRYRALVREVLVFGESRNSPPTGNIPNKPSANLPDELASWPKEVCLAAQGLVDRINSMVEHLQASGSPCDFHPLTIEALCSRKITRETPDQSPYHATTYEDIHPLIGFVNAYWEALEKEEDRIQKQRISGPIAKSQKTWIYNETTGRLTTGKRAIQLPEKMGKVLMALVRTKPLSPSKFITSVDIIRLSKRLPHPDAIHGTASKGWTLAVDIEITRSPSS